jgi:hypothetical protein
LTARALQSIARARGARGSLEVSGDGTTVVVALVGEFDLTTRDMLIECLESLHHRGPRSVVLDLTSTTFIDSTVINPLIADHRNGPRSRYQRSIGRASTSTADCRRTRNPALPGSRLVAALRHDRRITSRVADGHSKTSARRRCAVSSLFECGVESVSGGAAVFQRARCRAA